MGCCGGDREKLGALRAEQKWEYINLDDFKSHSCWTPFTYGYLIVMLLISISVYAVDTFTAINLLAFDRWSGQIKPAIPLSISRWIFAGCIILSFVLLIYRWWRAIRVMQQGGVARSYLDPLAVRVQSVRMGREGRGWKRFLVFAELTKSRKGADYVALFTYFTFEAWLRICFAEGPRQVINALTLYSVLQANLIPNGQHAATDGHSPVVQFFVNIGILASRDKLQAIILFGMLWTLFIWVISVISLIISVILFLLFLWHHIPSGEGGLTGYCRTKINRRMERVVRAKVDKALKKENQLRAREEAKAAREGTGIKKQPTLPDVTAITDGESLPPLSRQTTMTTLPEYSSRPPTGEDSDGSVHSQPLFGDMKGAPRPGPRRIMTHTSDASWSSYNSNAPLMNSASEMGYANPERSQTPTSATPSTWGRPTPNRSMTGQSQVSQRSFTPGPPRAPTAQGGRNTPGAYQMEPIARSGTGMSFGTSGGSNGVPPYPQSAVSSGGPMWTESPVDMQGRKTPVTTVNPYFPPIPEHGRSSPGPPRAQTPTRGPPERSFTPGGPPRSISASQPPTLPRVQTSGASSSGYIAFSPEQRSMTPASVGGSDLGYRSFSRPELGYAPPATSGRQTPQGYGMGRPPPQRQNSGPGLDDILKHY